MRHIAATSSITLGAPTIAGIIKRLQSLQHTLVNLHRIMRQLARTISARARVSAMQIITRAVAQAEAMPTHPIIRSLDDAIPP